jgi:acyl-coenzyme A synthetase/AMP-(fatty) acid ligase
VEIDGILLSHPAVSEAVCFAVPDEMYGQEIHAAVVVKQGQQVKEKELQDFVATKVAKFKVPKKVYPCEISVNNSFILRGRFRRLQQGKSRGQRSVKYSSNLNRRKPSCR